MELAGLNILYNMIDKLRQWYSGAVEKQEDAKLRQAARLLMSSGTVVAALRTLDNYFRDVMGILLNFDSEWSNEMCNSVKEKIRQLADQEQILPELIKARIDLQTMDKREVTVDEENEKVEFLIGQAMYFENVIGGSDVTPFPSREAMTLFQNKIRPKPTLDEVLAVREEAYKYLNLIDRQKMARIDIAFAELKGSILNRYPNLPEPKWAVEI